MPVKCQTIITFVEEMAPKALALEGDNTGWQVGDPDSEIEAVLLTMDVDGPVVDEALEINAGLIVAHHPLIHKPFRSLRLDLPAGALLARLVRAGLNVYAAHTNLDAAERGVNAVLTERLGLTEVNILSEESAVFGRIGRLKEPMSFTDFVELVKKALGVPIVRVGGPQGRLISKIALCGGSGGDFWPKAAFAGADVYVTGDLKYHTARDILAAGMNFVDPGHYPSERIILEPLGDYLAERCRAAGADVRIGIARTHQDPFVSV
jgi:dinuclear metal center YbgI/SA1388 family protein